MVMMPDVNVILVDFHQKRGKEMVVENEDGSFTIFINSRLANSSQFAAYSHAMKHIKNRDFQKENVQAIETVAHNAVIPGRTEHIPTDEDEYIRQIKAVKQRRRKIQKQLKDYQADMEFLNFSEDERFSRAEYQWLYGNNL